MPNNKNPTMGQMVNAVHNRADNYRPTPEQAIRAIVARFDGDFDNPELLAYGPLQTNILSDVEEIAACAMLGIQHMEKFHAG